MANHRRPSEAIVNAGVDIAPPNTNGSRAQHSSKVGLSFDAASPTEISIDCSRPVVDASTPRTKGRNATGTNATRPTMLLEKKTKRIATSTFISATTDVMDSHGTPHTSCAVANN